MAKPPYINLRQKDFPDMEQESFPKLLDAINQFGKQVRDGFNSKINVAENLTGYWEDIKIAVASSPLTIPTDTVSINNGLSYSQYFYAPYNNYEEPRLYLNNGVVTLTGSARSIIPNARKIFINIPPQFRPEQDNIFYFATYWVVAMANGDIYVTDTAGNNFGGSFSFGISWRANPKYKATYPFSQALARGFPLKLANRLPGKAAPKAIVVGNAYEISNQSKKAASLSGVSFQVLGDSIQIDYIGGAYQGKAYEVTLLILGE